MNYKPLPVSYYCAGTLFTTNKVLNTITGNDIIPLSKAVKIIIIRCLTLTNNTSKVNYKIYKNGKSR